MRGDDEQTGHLFSYLSPEQRVPADHSLSGNPHDDRRAADSSSATNSTP